MLQLCLKMPSGLRLRSRLRSLLHTQHLLRAARGALAGSKATGRQDCSRLRALLLRRVLQQHRREPVAPRALTLGVPGGARRPFPTRLSRRFFSTTLASYPLEAAEAASVMALHRKGVASGRRCHPRGGCAGTNTVLSRPLQLRPCRCLITRAETPIPPHQVALSLLPRCRPGPGV